MIILIEGPRGAGKSHLVDEFFRQNNNKRFMYYKFEFSNWIKRLKIENLEPKPEIHYFSISNILTIFDLVSGPFKDRTIVMDRSILSAYVWSIYRDRVDNFKLLRELDIIMRHDVFKESRIVFVTKSGEVNVDKRSDKDIFDKFEDYEQELNIYKNVIDMAGIESEDQGGNLIYFKNQFNEGSQLEFNNLLNNLVDK